MKASGSSAQGPTTAMRRGRAIGSTPSLASRVTELRAISRAIPRFRGESRSMFSPAATAPSGVQSASRRPSSAFCRSTRRRERSTNFSGTRSSSSAP
jgi:hypothetical protein